MEDKSPLRRWKRFLPAFGAIDNTIESALGCSRHDYRQVRGDLVEKLCDAADGGAERAEGLCLLLDQAMVEALQTLRLVAVTPRMLTSTDISKVIAGLRRHESGQVRGLARCVFDGWRASMEGHLTMVRATLEKLSQIPQEDEAAAAPLARDARSDREHESTVLVADTKRGAKVPDPELPVKMPPGVCSAGGDRVRGDRRILPTSRGCEAAARGRGDGRAEVEEARKVHPNMKQRSRASCLRSRDERPLSTSRRHRV